MNDMSGNLKFELRHVLKEGDAWTKLLALAEMIEMDQTAGTLTIRNGRSSLTLRADGRLTVQGVNIVQVAERNIALDAATIDLN